MNKTQNHPPRDANTPLAERFFQVLLIASTTALSWLGMMAVHELGHVAHLWISGGTVEYVLLHPARLSYTQPGQNPWPLFVAAGGALWGCGLPTAGWAITGRVAPRQAYLARFFAGFCLVANGAYLAADAFVAGGDGRQLIAQGTPPWLLVLAGVPTVACGLLLWHGQGPNFGLGGKKEAPHLFRPAPQEPVSPKTPVASGKIDRRAALALTGTLAVVVALELAFLP